MRPTKTLRVLPNPWLHIHIYSDSTAQAVAAVGVDLAEHVPDPNRYVGAKIVRVNELTPAQTIRVGHRVAIRQRRRDERFWQFAAEPETIPNTGYYRDRLQCRELIAADAETAKAAGLSFVDPAEALAEERARAIAAFDAAHGAGSWDDQGAEPDYAEPAKAAPAQTTEAAPEPASKPAKRTKDTP